ncbi:segregation and condensation protein A [Bacillus sp. NRRL B-14911]|nr:segregation and condensation protein A [Bacillus sp. NRRL B-14911]
MREWAITYGRLEKKLGEKEFRSPAFWKFVCIFLLDIRMESSILVIAIYSREPACVWRSIRQNSKLEIMVEICSIM